MRTSATPSRTSFAVLLELVLDTAADDLGGAVVTLGRGRAEAGEQESSGDEQQGEHAPKPEGAAAGSPPSHVAAEGTTS